LKFGFKTSVPAFLSQLLPRGCDTNVEVSVYARLLSAAFSAHDQGGLSPAEVFQISQALLGCLFPLHDSNPFNK